MPFRRVHYELYKLLGRVHPMGLKAFSVLFSVKLQHRQSLRWYVFSVLFDLTWKLKIMDIWPLSSTFQPKVKNLKILFWYISWGNYQDEKLSVIKSPLKSQRISPHYASHPQQESKVVAVGVFLSYLLQIFANC